jgi:nucleotide-binding universal stress UspA family protein
MLPSPAFKRVLCAVDFSRGSVEAFAVAIQTAKLQGAALHLFHVIEALPSGTGELMVQIVARASAAMEELVSLAQPSLKELPFTSETTSGRAYEEIVHRARDWKAELIVLGSKGVTSLEEMVIGGTAEAVVKEAPCSVMVVRT